MSHCKIVHKKTSVRAPILRRSRDIGTHHAIVSASQQETEAMVLAARREEWSRERSTQTSDSSDSEVDFFAAWPVTGESYCRCSPQEEPAGMPALEGARPDTDCLCGEDDQGFDWVWDEGCRSSAASLSCEDRKVSFHSDYSCGTAAIRGNRELADGQHFWEIKMTSPVYGTDMMVGIGTSEVNLEDNRHRFCSMLGADEDSWGLSYTGLLQHKGDKVSFSSKFGQGSIIGLHLDTWHGTLTFYKNRRHIGVAATKLQNKKLYPMVCSTAAKSSMKVIRACYTPTSLQYLCCSSLRRHLPACPDTLGALPLPPGLRHLLATRLGWIFSLNPQPGPEECEETPGEPSPPPSARSSPSACSDSSSQSPVPDLVPCRSPCSLQLPGEPACSCLPAACKDDSDGCSSEPEDYQSKRCRWT